MEDTELLTSQSRSSSPASLPPTRPSESTLAPSQRSQSVSPRLPPSRELLASHSRQPSRPPDPSSSEKDDSVDAAIVAPRIPCASTNALTIFQKRPYLFPLIFQYINLPTIYSNDMSYLFCLLNIFSIYIRYLTNISHSI